MLTYSEFFFLQQHKLNLSLNFQLEFEWQKFSINLESSNYSSWFLQYNGLDGLNSFSDQLLTHCFSSFWETVSRAKTTIRITFTFMFYNFVQTFIKVHEFPQLFAFFHFPFVVCWDGKVDYMERQFSLSDEFMSSC